MVCCCVTRLTVQGPVHVGLSLTWYFPSVPIHGVLTFVVPPGVPERQPDEREFRCRDRHCQAHPKGRLELPADLVGRRRDLAVTNPTTSPAPLPHLLRSPRTVWGVQRTLVFRWPVVYPTAGFRMTRYIERKTMNSKRILMATVAVALILALGLPAGAGEFFFQDGDTVVVMGDSITEQHLYSNYLEAWTLMRFPAWKITFHNVGIGGDTFPGRQRSICARRDGLQAHGADGGLRHERRRVPGLPTSPCFNNYMAGLAGIAKQAKASQTPRRVDHAQPRGEERGRAGDRGLQPHAGEVLRRASRKWLPRTADSSSTSFIPAWRWRTRPGRPSPPIAWAAATRFTSARRDRR